MKSIVSKLKNLFVKIRNRLIVISIIILIIIFVVGLLFPRNEDYEMPAISLLEVVSDTVSFEEVLTRNQFLVNTISQHQSLLSNFEVAEKDSRTQARLFYVTILAALFSLFIGKKIKSGSIIIVVIVTMYLYDIHSLDLQRRQHLSSVIVNCAKDSLVNMPHLSTIYYNINYKELHEHNAEINSDIISRIIRKSRRAIFPELEQSIFYIFPIILLLFIQLKSYRNNKIINTA